MYAGLTYLGTGKFSGLYGLNETIIDQKAIGLQHLFIDDYTLDLVHTACSVVVHQDKAHYGDRIKPKCGHPLRQKSTETKVTNHSIFEDYFKYESFDKVDRVVALNDQYIYFECEVTNTSTETQSYTLSSLCITHNNKDTKVSKYQDGVLIECQNKYLYLTNHGEDTVTRASLDAPSGFMYRGIEDLLYSKNELETDIVNDFAISTSLSKSVELAPLQSYKYQWFMVIGTDKEVLNKCITQLDYTQPLVEGSDYWKTWLDNTDQRFTSTDEELSRTALVALRSANLKGLLPADLTGHYFANNSVCFYVRDALMAARAYLYSSHFEEFESVINFLIHCPLKENGEFYQRYNALGLPDEGANNNVFSQIDAIGYFAADVADYHKLTGKMLVDYEYFKNIIDVLFTIERKNGLMGPEGGVNEGVYGPAYITSTNMFIAGGLAGAIYLADVFEDTSSSAKWTTLRNEMIAAIEETFLDEGYYAYGYVNYHDEIIKRYDTPQLFGASYGFPLTEKFAANFEFILKHATYFGKGIGYSEQEYHNGPWLFNTAAGAQVAGLLNREQDYLDLMNWMKKHRNDYGLLPEAVDATNEKIPFINPLMWANAEMVCACYIDGVKTLRGE